MSIVADVAQVGLSLMSASASIKAGKAQAEAYEQQARAATLQGKYIDIQADQAAAAAREELRSALATNVAMRAARNTSAAAGGAIEDEVSRRGRRKERIELLGIAAQKTAVLNEVANLRAAKAPAILSGYAGAASALSTAVGSVKRIGEKTASAFGGGG